MLEEFWNDEEGLSAVEYAVAGGIVIVGLLAVFTNLGQAVADRITQLVANLNS
jgi:pilus assembly protein Flp/PilA